MAEANLLEALSKVNTKNGSLEGLILYGKVRCAIQRPSILGNSLKVSDVGAFAILDVFAVKCLQEDYFGNNYNGLYFSRGSMIIFINSLDWVGEIVKVSGAYAKYGVKVRQQWSHKTPYDGITALAFQKQGSNFIVVPNYMIKLGDKDPDLNMTPMEDFVVKLKSDNITEFPVTLDSIMDYEGVADYVEVNADEVKDINDTYNDSGEGKIDVSKIDMKLTYHLDAMPITPFMKDVKDDINNMSKARKEYAKELFEFIKGCMKDDDSIYDTSVNIRNAFYDRVLSSYSKNIGNSTVKGKVYASQFISEVSGKPFSVEDDFKMPPQGELNKSIETLTSIIQMDASMLKTEGDELGIPMLRDDVQIATVVVGMCTGVGVDSLRSNYYACSKATNMRFDEWFYLIVNLPYTAGMLGSSLNVADCDNIYFSFTRYFTDCKYNKECADMRNNLVYLKTLEDASDKNTFIHEKELKGMSTSYPGMAKRHLTVNHFPCKKDLIELLSVLCNRRVELSEKEVQALEGMSWYSKERTNELIEKGIVNTIDDFIALERDVEKEVMIYETLIMKGAEPTGITEEQVGDAIDEFEAEKGFCLEDLQKEGVKLCMYKAAVLSGCAGSGKTTTSDCFTLCLKENLKDYTIVYCTPTGKACRRLAEVVGGVVKTIHSQFGVGMYGEGYLTDIKKKYQDWSNPSKIIYICDEMAMCNSNLLYEIVRSLGPKDIIYLLGDCKQLPPIGKGNPFHLLMKMLPCVELGVSKRAAEGSQVNYNTTLINCASDDTIQELYYDESTFFCRECPDIEIPNVVTTVWKKFMEGTMNGKEYEEDDIQVISGYATPEKSFSTTNLNKPIQQFLRKNDKLLFRYGDNEFYKNERVIHARLNSYGTQRYIEIEENTFKSVVTLGIMNGEVGKIVGITRTDFTQIEEFDESDLESWDEVYGDLDDDYKNTLLETRQRLEEKIRDDAGFRNENYYYVKVKVYDTDLHRDVIVLYPARAHQQDDVLVLGGEDLGNIDLAYALTTHKMQGSQAKVVICPFGSTCNPQFINRNMLNTMFSRSEEVVCCIGDVKGIESPITKGRKNVSPIETDCMMSWLCSD